jgi:hypothetical protein
MAASKGISMRVWPVLILLPLLAGCSGIDWDSLTSFGTSSEDEVAPVAPAQVATAAPTPAPAQGATQVSQFCTAVAKEDAMGAGFDTPTQQRVALRSYQQCVQIFGDTAQR